jgi:hypothetical protein
MAIMPLMYLKYKRDSVNFKYDRTFQRFYTIVKRESITRLAEVGKVHMQAFMEQVIQAE